MRKKGMGLGDAPTVLMIVALAFLVAGTVAFIGEKYQNSFPSVYSHTVVNETINASSIGGGGYVDASGACNFGSFSIVQAINYTTGHVVGSGNYSGNSATGLIVNITDENVSRYWWNVTYTYKEAGKACNVTNDLNSNISSNTSILGIVLTISLVAIILIILIGVFSGFGRKRGV